MLLQSNLKESRMFLTPDSLCFINQINDRKPLTALRREAAKYGAGSRTLNTTDAISTTDERNAMQGTMPRNAFAGYQKNSLVV